MANRPMIIFLGVKKLLDAVCELPLEVLPLLGEPVLPVIIISSAGILAVTSLVNWIFTIVPILTENPLMFIGWANGAVSSFDLSTTDKILYEPFGAERKPLSNWFFGASLNATFPKPLMVALLNVEPLGMIISLYCDMAKVFYGLTLQIYKIFRSAVGHFFFFSSTEVNLKHYCPIAGNGRGYTLGLFFTNWRYSPCYWSGLKKEKRRGEKKFENFYFKMI